MDRKIYLSFTLPYPKLIQRISGLSFSEFRNNFLYRVQTLSSLFSQFFRFPSFNKFFRRRDSGYQMEGSYGLHNRNRFRNILSINKKNIIRILFPVIIILVGVYAVYSATSSARSSNKALVNNTIVSVGEAIGVAEINREFAFPIKDAKGKEIDSFSYVLQDAELRDEIIVKGKRATAVEGRMFLIINLKITNATKHGLQINTRDYIRLSVNNDASEWLAGEIHNDPVEVQAISTKYTRIGFPINKSDKNYTIQIGEIDGTKEQIKLDFK